MTDPHREELILRYITGKLSSDAALRARTYLDETPRGHVVGIGLRQVMAADVLEGGAPNTQTSLARLLARLDHEIPHLPGTVADGVGVAKPAIKLPRLVGAVPTGVRWYTAASVAAVVAVVVLMIGMRGLRSHSAQIPVSTYTTGNGQRATITLPDGNTVALNVASRLEVPVNYLNGNHTLRLRTGAALFAITHQTGTPLTVLADSTAVRVLGTSFVVRHYPNDSAVIVAVQQGKVAVQSTVLAADQETMVSHSGIAAIHSASPGLFSFTTGVLTLEDMPLPAAIVELNRWYDADIRLGDPALATQRMKGKFAMGSLADLSGILELTFNVRVVRDGRVLTLYPR